MGTRFRAPKRRDIQAWKKIELTARSNLHIGHSTKSNSDLKRTIKQELENLNHHPSGGAGWSIYNHGFVRYNFPESK